MVYFILEVKSIIKGSQVEGFEAEITEECYLLLCLQTHVQLPFYEAQKYLGMVLSTVD